jgi:predicted secreted hydrolase
MGQDDFSWNVLRRWKSPNSQSNYPVETTLSGLRPDGSPYQLLIKPLFDEQELTGELGGIAYWEGACDILEKGKVVGEAYMELTGYNESLESQLR